MERGRTRSIIKWACTSCALFLLVAGVVAGSMTLIAGSMDAGLSNISINWESVSPVTLNVAWLTTLIATAVPAYGMWRNERKDRKPLSPVRRCHNCDYDLSGLTSNL